MACHVTRPEHKQMFDPLLSVSSLIYLIDLGKWYFILFGGFEWP